MTHVQGERWGFHADILLSAHATYQAVGKALVGPVPCRGGAVGAQGARVHVENPGRLPGRDQGLAENRRKSGSSLGPLVVTEGSVEALSMRHRLPELT